ncbi:hypothetical protein DM860_010588 [Cuscuta australis]|uniref:F-box protein n=1 Tax=Cuscuta australis TaxID=267555 RepID=A0A328E2X5_9ASTE|nr:hypothetical protein DM860_010588 [Cuscuta australis]
MKKKKKELLHPQQWQVIVLVANHLDPTTLALASCVSKLWFLAMSSDHLWQPIVASTYPSLPALPYRRLYALGRASDKRSFQKKRQQPPLLCMSDLIFSVTVSLACSPVAAFAKSGSELGGVKEDAVFLFDINLPGGGGGVADMEEGLRGDSLRVTWEAVLEGYGCKFTMLEWRGGGGRRHFAVSGTEVLYSEELPAPGCCAAASGLAADVRVGWKEKSCGRVVVEKIRLGVMSVVSWRYVQVVDALRYLQHFLLD